MNTRIPHKKKTHYINYLLKSEVSITFHFQLCFNRYTAVKNQEKVATTKNMDTTQKEATM